MAAFPSDPEAISVEWLNAQRLGQGPIAEDGGIDRFEWERVGTGQVGDSVRLKLTYRAGHDGPDSLVAKLPSPDPTSRATAGAFQLYRKEVGFYQELAGHLDVRVPSTFAVEIAPEGAEFIILFEDLGPARGGNQLDSCDLEDARAAILQAAALHGPSHGNADLLSAEWLQPRADLGVQLMALYPQAQAVFRARYSDALEPDLMEICEGLAGIAELWFGREPEAPCLIHGDFRLDNMLFDIKGGAEPIAVLDWQTVAVGDGLTDIGYFLGCGVGSALRRPHEAELLDLYAEEMARRGVRLAASDLMDRYRIGALHGVATAVFSSANVVRTDRGDANFLSMARGASELARDHDSLGVLRHRTRSR
jgi:hypothetical protein